MKFIHALLCLLLSISTILDADKGDEVRKGMICKGKHEFEPCGTRVAKVSGQCVKLLNNRLACRRPGEFCQALADRKSSIVNHGRWGKDKKDHLTCIEQKREATAPVKSFRSQK